MDKTLILLTNNKFADPFLHSQLINLYKESNFKKIYLFCGLPNDKSSFCEDIILKDNFINSKKGFLRYFSYYFSVFTLLLKLKNKNVTIHLRGFVSALMFCFIPSFYLRKLNYIYDPRGAFIYGKQEVFPKLKKILTFLRYFEKRLIKKSLFTIVESKKLKEQMTSLYGNEDKYTVCYNVSSFSNHENIKVNFDKEVRVCYCGSVNHWHDINEIKRLFEYVNIIFKNQNIKNYIFTQKRNHEIVKNHFKDFDYHLKVDFIPYNRLENELKNMDICLSVVLPNKSTQITSPIKISDYILLDKVMILNKGIGDFDSFFEENKSAILYDFNNSFNFSKEDIINLDIKPNNKLKPILSIDTNRKIILDKIFN